MDIKPTALGLLLNAKGAVGELVKAYASRGDLTEDWLESWFSRRIQLHFTSGIPEDKQVIPITRDFNHVTQASQRLGLRLISLTPHYFRGFKALPHPVELTGGLIVVEGKNSSGKTSLAEALEFLFRGSLSRREEHGERNPVELENCIENQFRPKGESTFVEATFVKYSGTPNEKQLVLRRLLIKDYGATSNSTCESKLHLDGSELSKEAEAAVQEDFFSFVPPLLMQHTLRSFVLSPPSRRRQYFERILSLDELTNLISRAVIGDAKMPGLKSPQGSYGLSQWETLIDQLKNSEAKTAAHKAKSIAQMYQAKALANALIDIATLEFASAAVDLGETENWIDQQQQAARQQSFPLLTQMRPKRQPNHELSTTLAGFELHKANLETRWKGYESAKASTNAARERYPSNCKCPREYDSGRLD